jgi:hypothetical protein
VAGLLAQQAIAAEAERQGQGNPGKHTVADDEDQDADSGDQYGQ